MFVTFLLAPWLQTGDQRQYMRSVPGAVATGLTFDFVNRKTDPVATAPGTDFSDLEMRNRLPDRDQTVHRAEATVLMKRPASN